MKRGDLIRMRGDNKIPMLVLEITDTKKTWHRTVTMVPICCPSLTLSGIQPILIPWMAAREFEIISSANE